MSSNEHHGGDEHDHHDDDHHDDDHHHHHGHGRGHGSDQEHGHTHGVIDPSILSTSRGIWAVKWSFVGLSITALLQVAVVIVSGSVALLADTIHNVGDAATAIPLGIAFLFARLKPSKRFPYGYGRVEDLAGVIIVAIILFSAIVAGYESIERLLHPRKVEYLWAVIAASLIGFVGNEVVAVFRIRVGRKINSVALIADGYHARVDGWTSLSVLFGAIGVWLGFPLADPLIGLGITVAILGIVWQSAVAVFTRMLDGVEPNVIDDIAHAAAHVKGVREVAGIRARWIGHHLSAEIGIAVDPESTLAEAEAVIHELKHEVHRHVPFLSHSTVHVKSAKA